MSVFGIEFYGDLYLATDGSTRASVSEECWFTDCLEHAQWYANFKQERNSQVKGVCEFSLDNDGLPVSLLTPAN
jgi:hypothetical protein